MTSSYDMFVVTVADAGNLNVSSLCQDISMFPYRLALHSKEADAYISAVWLEGCWVILGEYATNICTIYIIIHFFLCFYVISNTWIHAL